MSDDTTKKVLISRRVKVAQDDHGRSDWVDPVESAELELVSTQMLKVMLTSRDDADRQAIKEVADNATDGVLARDPANGEFAIIDEDELQAILDNNQDLPKLTRPADATLGPLRDYANDDQLSLVSAQALRKVLSDDDDDAEEPEMTPGESAGFNPYHSS